MSITAYKCTRANGRDFRTDSVEYGVGSVVERANCDSAEHGPCGVGLHVSPTPYAACLFGNTGIDRGRWRWFEVSIDEADLLARDDKKLRVRRLTVVREIPRAELFGDMKAGAAKVRTIAATYKRIKWLRPSRAVTDAEVKALVKQWRERLAPWATRPIPEAIRIVRTAADAAAADADVAAAADADVAAAADADAAADIPRWWYWSRWYVRPYWALRRFAWFEFARKPRQANPFEPFVRLYRMGCLPIGFCRGKSGPGFVVYVPKKGGAR